MTPFLRREVGFFVLIVAFNPLQMRWKMSDLFFLFSSAVLEASAIRLTMNLKPANADGLVYPPTYEQGRHIFRPAWINGEKRDGVILDSVQSQANRVEMAILDAYQRGRLNYPDIELIIKASTGEERYSVLELSHRVYDAVLRMSTLNGVLFDKTPIGTSIYSARLENATALYTHAPITLALGGWDSHGGGGPLVAKIPRLLTSEIIGLDAMPVEKGTVKSDPLDIRKDAGPIYDSTDQDRVWEVDKSKAVARGKEYKPSEKGFGSVPSLSEQGAVITEAIQTSLISCSAARRIRFKGENGNYNYPRDKAGQIVIMALAVYGLIAQMESGYYLRSGCNLFPLHEPKMEIIGRTLEEINYHSLNSTEALNALIKALAEAEGQGLKWRQDKMVVEADERLLTLVERSRKARNTED
jgi:CRISPR-associated protein Csb1